MNEFTGKVVAVTGGAGGLGSACARRFHAEGATVVIADRDTAAAEQLAEELGDRAHPLGFDMRDDQAIEDAIRGIAERFGRLDVLVNSAGMRCIRRVPDLQAEEWRSVMSLNADGTFFTARSFARVLLEQGRPGAIVNIASISGIMGQVSRSAYVTSKHAVVGITRSLGMELAPAGIRVNAVAPGVIVTAMSADHMRDPAKVERMAHAHPIGRPGQPQEVAAAVRFLASDEASFITGAVLPVDGGYSAGKDW